MKTLIAKAEALVREWDGPLTQELVQKPVNVGLGKVHWRLRQGAPTTRG